MTEIAAKDGETVAVGALLGQIKDGAGAAPSRATPQPAGQPDRKSTTTAPIAAGAVPVSAKPSGDHAPLAPSVRKMSAESGVDPASVAGTRQG